MSPDDGDAISAAKRFFFAVAVGDGDAVWEELSEGGRAHVVNVAVQQGMDFDLASRLRSGDATAQESAEYRDNLARGVQRDLDGIDLSNLAFEAEGVDDLRVRVRYAVRLDLALPADRAGGGRPPPTIPAGSVIVVKEVGRWRVERLVPRPGP